VGQILARPIGKSLQELSIFCEFLVSTSKPCLVLYLKDQELREEQPDGPQLALANSNHPGTLVGLRPDGTGRFSDKLATIAVCGVPLL
jgi:hypothetical protein